MDQKHLLQDVWCAESCYLDRTGEPGEAVAACYEGCQDIVQMKFLRHYRMMSDERDEHLYSTAGGLHYVGLISARVLSFGEDCFLQVTWLLTVTHEQGTAADLAIEKRLLIMHAINHTSC